MTVAVRHRLRVYRLETTCEFLKVWRTPAAMIFGFGLPVLFYTAFGLIFGRESSPGGVSYGAYYIAMYGAFSVISSALFGLGVNMATERSQGWLLLKRASPMPPEADLLARIAVSLLSAFVIVGLLGMVGALLLGVRLPFTVWVRLIAVMLAGAIPFCALGLAVGCWTGPTSAVAIVNVINIPGALASGLWIPLEILPAFARRVAVFFPQYHYCQLALATLGAGLHHPVLGHVLVLVGFSLVCLSVAYAGHRRADERAHG